MRHTPLTALLSGLLFSAPALAEEKREADAHEHGHGAFNMAIEGETVAIELETPAFDILGFEHETKSGAEIDAVETARRALADPVALFGLPDAAECQVTEAEIEIGAEAEHHDEHDDHAHDEKHDEEGGEHSEVHAHYTLTCGTPGEIGGVNAAAYFKAFPNAEELEAVILTDAGQASGELEAGSPDLSF